MKERLLQRIISCFFLLFVFFPSDAQRPAIIQFGWNYPDVSLLDKRLDSIQNTPFDGICFALQRPIMEAFDTTLKADSYYKYKKLKTLKWGKYRNNFIILRGFAKTGGLWFNDTAWKTIAFNMEKLSKAMKVGNLKGILFDPEYYYKDPLFNPWTYTADQYPAQSFQDVQVQVRKRGVQFITALQKYKPAFHFLSIWITSLIAAEKPNTPLQNARQALLVSFIEGVLEGKSKLVKITDGNEYAYWYKKPSQYLESSSRLKKITAELMQSSKAKSKISEIQIALPVYYDGALGKVKGFNTVTDDNGGWKCLEENMKYAMAAADSFVWFYSERLNCWQGNDNNDTLYSIIEDAKNKMQSPTVKRKPVAHSFLFKTSVANINEGRGYYYLSNPQAPLQTGDTAFSFSVNKKKNIITVKFGDKIPVSVSAYIDNRLLPFTNLPGQSVTLQMGKKKKRKLVIVAKYADKTEASAINFF